jgi:hypothetical protein
MIVALLQLPSFSSARCATASSRGGGWKPKSWYLRHQLKVLDAGEIGRTLARDDGGSHLEACRARRRRHGHKFHKRPARMAPIPSPSSFFAIGVIGTNTSLTGYGGGLDRKRWLLAHESACSASRGAQFHPDQVP